MPASYAHYRFGKRILSALPENDRRLVQRFRRMFDVGLQGPDIFFYYNPFLKTAVGDLGGKLHAQTGQEFFSHACTQAASEAARAYLYGVLGHYCLDSVCHPYVQKIVDIGEAGHVALESEFDRFLLEQDKVLTPHTYDMGRHIRLTRGECMTAAEFYPPATGANVSQSVKFMALSLKVLSNPNRARTEKLLKKLKPSLCDNLVPEEEVEELAPYINELFDHYNRALERYPLLLQQLKTHIQTGEALGEDFAPNFG